MEKIMIRVELVLEEGKTPKEEVTAEIAKFEEWFKSYLKNTDPLSSAERAILNDYLGWKVAKIQG
jgi:hypothetical protein